MKKGILLIGLFFSLAFGYTVQAQSDISYQGRLDVSGQPANANYDFEFRLFDAAAGGNLLGTQTRLNVAVAGGVFNVQLGFLTALFDGNNRFLEIAVRPAGGGGGYQQLLPRQPVTSVPYSIKSLTADYSISSLTADTATSATTAVTATNFTGSLAGNVSGTQGATVVNTVGGQTAASVANAVLTVNSASNANIPNTLVMRNANGDFSAGTIFATQQYNIGINRVLGINGINNIFVGVNAGILNSTGNSNAFFGNSAGESNTTGSSNSFFGSDAGESNTTGIFNSFFGRSAGRFNTTGDDNSFFGSSAGQENTTGYDNSFFGNDAGILNTTGFRNSFFGRNAGGSNTTGDGNAFFGYRVGQENTIGYSNSFFGRTAGFDNTTGSGNSFFGNSAGASNTTGISNAFFGGSAGESNTTGDYNTIIGNGADVGSGNLSYATALGAGSVVSTSDTVVLGRTEDIVRIPGFLRVVQLGSPGAVSLCQNVNFTISTCSSSIRYKSNVNSFRSGLSLIKRLRPVSFNWKEGGMLDMGLVAEEVAEVEPLLVTTNKQGEIEGVKYDRIGVVLVNAVNEQQTQIESQQKQIDGQNEIIKRQQTQIDELKTLVCASNPTAELCKPKTDSKEKEQ